MEQNHLEVILEDMLGKFELVLEGHAALNAKIDANQAKTDEKFDHIAFQLKTLSTEVKTLSTEVKTVREESNQKHEQTATLLKAIANDLSAHRTDTEAHPRYQVREPSPE